MKPSEGSYAARVTAWCSSHVIQDCKAFGAPGGFHTELGSLLLAFFTSGSSMCSSRDEEGKGSVLLSLLAVAVYRKRGSLLPDGRGDAGVPSPQLPPCSSPVLRLPCLLPGYTRILSLVSAVWSQPPSSSSSQYLLQCRKTSTQPCLGAGKLGSVSTGGNGRRQEMYCCFVGRSFSFKMSLQEKRTRWKIFIRNRILKN